MQMRMQILIAVLTYGPIGMVRKRLEIEHELSTMLQILRGYSFEKVSPGQLLTAPACTPEGNGIRDQSSLFNS